MPRLGLRRARRAKSLIVTAEKKNIAVITEFIDNELAALGCTTKQNMQLDVAVDEVFANISDYAYGDAPGTCRVAFRYDPLLRAAVIKFYDNGIPYDPLEAPEPDVSLPASERKPGGLGVFLIKKLMDDVRYERRNGQNVLTIIKRIGDMK